MAPCDMYVADGCILTRLLCAVEISVRAKEEWYTYASLRCEEIDMLGCVAMGAQEAALPS